MILMLETSLLLASLISCRVAVSVFVNGNCSVMSLTKTHLISSGLLSLTPPAVTVPYFHFSMVHNKTTVQHYEILWSDVTTPV